MSHISPLTPLAAPNRSSAITVNSLNSTLQLKRPSFLCFNDNSSDSGYASIPTDDLQKKKKSRFRAAEDQNEENCWFSSHLRSPTMSNKSNTSSLDGFPPEVIAEVSASPGFTALQSSPIIMPSGSRQPQPQSRTSLEPETSRREDLWRSMSMSADWSGKSAGRFKRPAAPLRFGPVTRSMTRSFSTGQEADPQEDNRKFLMDLKEDPDVLPDGSR